MNEQKTKYCDMENGCMFCDRLFCEGKKEEKSNNSLNGHGKGINQMDNELLNKAADGATIALSSLQEMISDRDERIFDSAILSRIEEIKKLIELLMEHR